MRLIGERIMIRDFTLNDVEDYWAYAKDPAVAGPAGMRPAATRRQIEATLRQFIATRSDFAVVYRGKVIGNVGAYPRTADPDSPDARTREIGYALARAYWGQGLMREALTLLCDYLFLAGMDALWAGVFPENRRSIRLLEHLGFAYQFTVPLPVALTPGIPRSEAYYCRTKDA